MAVKVDDYAWVGLNYERFLKKQGDGALLGYQGVKSGYYRVFWVGIVAVWCFFGKR